MDSTNNQNKTSNPLLCDPEEGVCEVPKRENQASSVQIETVPQTEKPIKVLYFTDPICSSCWGIEPQLRKLKLEYGAILDIEYRMGGLLPDWSYNSGGISKPSDVASHWDEVSPHYDMPIDGDVWLEDPLDSSYPPSIAFKAAQLQDDHKAHLFLRKIREYVFLEKKNITKWEHLLSAAQFVGLEVDQFEKDYHGKAKTLFEEDLALAQMMRVRSFPTLFFSNESGQQSLMVGVRPYQDFEKKIKTLAPATTPHSYEHSPEFLFSTFTTLTAREYAEFAGMERTKVDEFLENLCDEDWLDKYPTKHGNLYFRKGK